MWQHIQDYIDQQIHKLMESLYQKLNKKKERKKKKSQSTDLSARDTTYTHTHDMMLPHQNT